MDAERYAIHYSYRYYNWYINLCVCCNVTSVLFTYIRCVCVFVCVPVTSMKGYFSEVNV